MRIGMLIGTVKVAGCVLAERHRQVFLESWSLNCRGRTGPFHEG